MYIHFDEMNVSYIQQLIAEAYLKQANERSSKPLLKALGHAETAVAVIEKIIGKKGENEPEVNNYLLA